MSTAASAEPKHEFGSNAWFDHARQVLDDLVAEAGADLRGLSFSACEVFTDAPEHLCKAGETKIYWWFKVAENEAVMLREQHPADYEVSVDYRDVLPRVRVAHPEPANEAQSGRFPLALVRLTRHLHNRIAAATA